MHDLMICQQNAKHRISSLARNNIPFGNGLILTKLPLRSSHCGCSHFGVIKIIILVRLLNSVHISHAAMFSKINSVELYYFGGCTVGKYGSTRKQ